MKYTNALQGKSLICTQDWKKEELDLVLDLALAMKENRYDHHLKDCLKNRTFFMFFYNPSVRTRQSFEAAATELGGHAQFLEPKSMRLKTEKTAGETIEDAAKVMSRYAVGLGVRILEDKIPYYGAGEALIREYEQFSSIPVFSMAHDKYHPFQGLADIMGLKEHLQELKGKKVLMVWGHGGLARSWCSVQEHLLIASRFGMSVRLAYPRGYDLDSDVIEKTKKNCENNSQEFSITHDMDEAYKDVHVVYSRNWMSPEAYQDGEFHKPSEIEKAMKHKEWICDEEKMKLTSHALFIHPMPVDRGNEVTDGVASSSRSIIYDVAENRLHVQKAVMALTMGKY
ncbi:MAG: ornithine carbamoyltransferase [Spirochaetes bacterium]|nr:ornithine carbamoyltransferase [Spirochaetota bacterium]